MNKLALTLFALVLLSGCATPLPKSEATPVFPAKPAASTAVAVVDFRSFILDGDKEEWFEGIFRTFPGIPHSLERPGDDSDRPFSVFLATMLKESIEAAGGKASIVEIPKGTPMEQAIATVAKEGAAVGLVAVMYQSRYDSKMVKLEYNYRFEVVVLDGAGMTLARKEFHELDTEIELSTTYNHFDSMTLLYRKALEKILTDPEIKDALAAAAN